MSCACVLKPQIQLKFDSATSTIKHATPDIQDCTWTYEREVLPPQLESHDIPLEMWKTAWDMVYQQVDNELTLWKEQNRKVRRKESIPPNSNEDVCGRCTLKVQHSKDC